MASQNYIDADSLASYLQEITHPKPPGCSGFNIIPCHKGLPIVNVHYDELVKKPKTKLCEHNGTCQPFAEFGYLLLHAFANELINTGHWRALFPTRDSIAEGFRGCPRFSPPYNDCCGFKCIQGPGIRENDHRVQNTIRLGYEIDPTTMSAYTSSCTHDQCDPTAPYLYALYKAFGSDLLLEYGYDINTSEPHSDPMYMLTNYGWAKALDTWSFGGAADWKNVIMHSKYWPRSRFSVLHESTLWEPSTLVKNVPQPEVMDESSSQGPQEPQDSDRGRRSYDTRIWTAEYYDAPIVHMMRTPRSNEHGRSDMYFNFVLRQDASRIVQNIIGAVDRFGTYDDIRSMRQVLDTGRRTLSFRGRRFSR
ncbi:unnamed protein product [Orchesella dallaii]|uniref:Uncharacterized protein n=1 Tax=Orchesella dallaii TaxID=48710 RepID=A0ABP1S640_9HEXA